MIICTYDQSLTYLVTIYIGFAMDWFCETISESWNTANTFQLSQPHVWDFMQADKLALKSWAAGSGGDVVSSEQRLGKSHIRSLVVPVWKLGRH